MGFRNNTRSCSIPISLYIPVPSFLFQPCLVRKLVTGNDFTLAFNCL